MKTPLIAAALAGSLATAQAQQFSGSPTTTGPIDRVGDITTFGRLGIGRAPTIPS